MIPDPDLNLTYHKIWLNEIKNVSQLYIKPAYDRHLLNNETDDEEFDIS